MKIVKIASESTNQLYEINQQLTALQASFEDAKKNLNDQYVPQIKTMEQQRDFLIKEVVREEEIQMQQQQQIAQQQMQPVAPVAPAPAVAPDASMAPAE